MEKPKLYCLCIQAPEGMTAAYRPGLQVHQRLSRDPTLPLHPQSAKHNPVYIKQLYQGSCGMLIEAAASVALVLD